MKIYEILEVFVARILIVYESKYGQTEKIAKFIFERMVAQGHSVNLMNLRSEEVFSTKNFDAILVGGPIYMRRYPKRLQKWAQVNAKVLNQKPTGFFTVCMAVLQNDLRVQRDLLVIANRFFKKTTWYPKRREVFAGALSYPKYDWLTKQIMSLIARANKGETDTSRSHEYTSWKDVVRFCDDFSNALLARHSVGPEIYST